jgi:hypothetical protein
MTFAGNILSLPVGTDGMNGAENLALVEPTQLIDARNISYSSGAITREGGAEKFNAVTLGAVSVIGGRDWWPLTNTQRSIVLTSDGSAYRDTGAGTYGTTLLAGAAWTIASVAVFVEGGKEDSAADKKLFIATGDEQVQVLTGDGVALADLGANMPADWVADYPTTLCSHDARLWGAGNSNQPHTVYYSTTTDHEDFSGGAAGIITVYPGEGTKIVALASFKGLLIIWKYPKGIYVIDTTDMTAPTVACITRSVGGAGPRCFCEVDDDILFLDASGSFHLLSAVQEFGDVATSSISKRVYWDTWMRSNITLSQLPKVRAVYYGAKREAHFSLAGVGSTVRNKQVVWDFNAQLPRVRYNDIVTCESLWMSQDSNGISRPVAGDNAGFVWLLDQATWKKDTDTYSSRWQSAHFDLAQLGDLQAARRKNGQFLELVITPQGTWDEQIEIYWDGNLYQTIQYNMGGLGTALGVFTLGTHTLSGGAIKNVKHRVIGSGRWLSIAGLISGSGEAINISRFVLHYTMGSERT